MHNFGPGPTLVKRMLKCFAELECKQITLPLLGNPVVSLFFSSTLEIHLAYLATDHTEEISLFSNKWMSCIMERAAASYI